NAEQQAENAGQYERYRIQALIILNRGISRRSDRLKPLNKRVIGLYGESYRGFVGANSTPAPLDRPAGLPPFMVPFSRKTFSEIGAHSLAKNRLLIAQSTLAISMA